MKRGALFVLAAGLIAGAARDSRAQSSDSSQPRTIPLPGIKGGKYVLTKKGRGHYPKGGAYVKISYTLSTLRARGNEWRKIVSSSGQVLSLDHYIDPCLKTMILHMRSGGSASLLCPPQSDYIPALFRAGKIKYAPYPWPKTVPPHWFESRLYQIKSLKIVPPEKVPSSIPPQYPLGIEPGS